MSGDTTRLLKAYAGMAALTLSAIIIGHAHTATPLGPVLLCLLLGLTFAKSAILLAHYLDLRHAPRWNTGLNLSIAILLVAIAGLSLAAALRG